jgi:hypothetical protein
MQAMSDKDEKTHADVSTIQNGNSITTATVCPSPVAPCTTSSLASNVIATADVSTSKSTSVLPSSAQPISVVKSKKRAIELLDSKEYKEFGFVSHTLQRNGESWHTGQFGSGRDQVRGSIVAFVRLLESAGTKSRVYVLLNQSGKVLLVQASEFVLQPPKSSDAAEFDYEANTKLLDSWINEVLFISRAEGLLVLI